MKRRKDLNGRGLREAEIKALVLTQLHEAGILDKKSVVASEFSLLGTSCRVDLAIMGSTFVGIEIKSAADTLRRLPHQVSTYCQFFDQVIVVAAPNHAAVLRASELGGAQVWALTHRGTLDIDDAFAFSSNHRRELRTSLLTKRDRDRFAGQKSEICDPFEMAFRARYEETSRRFWSNLRGKTVSVADIERLSPYYDTRTRQTMWRQAREARWAEWTREAARTWGEPSACS